MGSQISQLDCCKEGVTDKQASDADANAEVQQVASDSGPVLAQPKQKVFKVQLRRDGGSPLGIDVDYMAERQVLPVVAVTTGLVAQWNASAGQDRQVRQGDAIIEVNGFRGNATTLMDRCGQSKALELAIMRSLSYDSLVCDLEEVIAREQCGHCFIQLSWYDVGPCSPGGGTTPAPRVKDDSEYAARADLCRVALTLLAPIASKYCPLLLSNADLWALAANVSVHAMGGPLVPTRFGRVDPKGKVDTVQAQLRKLQAGDTGPDIDRIRSVFRPKGCVDKALVALSGGPLSESRLRFDNKHFQDLLKDPPVPAEGNRQQSGQLFGAESEAELLQDKGCRSYVEKYAVDCDAFLADFAEVWTTLQEDGCYSLRDVL